MEMARSTWWISVLWLITGVDNMQALFQNSLYRLVGYLCIVFFMLATPVWVSAAVLFSEPVHIEATPHQRFEVSVFLDTQLDDINALEGQIVFPGDLLELQEVRDGNSIVNFWIERPQNG